MRRAPQVQRPSWQVVVREPLEAALDTVRAGMARGGYRLVSLPGEVPLVFRRGSVASYALAAAHLARYSVVRAAATEDEPGTVELTFQQDRAQHPEEAADALESAVASLVAGWSARGVLTRAQRQGEGPRTGREEASR